MNFVSRGYTLVILTTFDLRRTFYRSSSLQTCQPPKTPNPMHSGPGCGFIALALTRAFDRYVGRGGGGGTKKVGVFNTNIRYIDLQITYINVQDFVHYRLYSTHNSYSMYAMLVQQCTKNEHHVQKRNIELVDNV